MWLDNDPTIGVVLDVVTVSKERRQEGQSPDDRGRSYQDRPAELALKMGKMPGPRAQVLLAEKTNWDACSLVRATALEPLRWGDIKLECSVPQALG